MNLGYIISTIIASLILLSLVGLNSRIMRSSGEQTLYTMAKIESDMVVDILKEDMRRMGYRVENPPIISIAEENRIRFFTHISEDENPDLIVIDWFFSDVAVSGRNPNVRPLYRRQSVHDPSNDPMADSDYDPSSDPFAVQIGTGIAQFNLEYLDSQRGVLTNPQAQLEDIRQIRVELIAESLESYNPNRFERSTWSGEITPYNLTSNF